MCKTLTLRSLTTETQCQIHYIENHDYKYRHIILQRTYFYSSESHDVDLISLVVCMCIPNYSPTHWPTCLSICLSLSLSLCPSLSLPPSTYTTYGLFVIFVLCSTYSHLLICHQNISPSRARGLSSRWLADEDGLDPCEQTGAPGWSGVRQ